MNKSKRMMLLEKEDKMYSRHVLRLSTFLFVCCFILAGMVVLIAPRPAQASTIYVNAAATGANDGSTWGDAYTDLQDALGQAQSGDEIWVAAGTYYPGSSGDRSATFQLKDGVQIYGGFAGDETDLSQRNWRTNVTILSGDLDGDGTWTNNDAYHVVSASTDVSDTARLDGFTITGGNANDPSNDTTSSGGGLYVYYNSSTFGNPVLENLIFSRNYAYYYGGGAFFDLGSSPIVTLTNVVFNNSNTAEYGAALQANFGTFNFTNCLFNGNHSNYIYGGTIYDQYSTMTFVNTTFANNLYPVISSDGSASSPSSVTLINSILWDNSDTNTPVLLYGSGVTGFNVSYSDVQDSGGSSAWALSGVTDGGNNIDADPLYLAVLWNDCRVFPGSPVIDAGNNSAVPDGITTDLDGNPRITNGTVDMGAYESPLVFENYTTGDDSTAYFGDTSWLAQTFKTTSAHSVSAVGLKISSYSDGNITVSIRATDGSGAPTGADLCSGTINALSVTTTPDWYVVPMTSNCSLLNDTLYAIVVRGTEPAEYGWQYNSAGTYSNGYSFVSDSSGSAWSQWPISGEDPDFIFEVLGYGTAATYDVIYDSNGSTGGSVPMDGNTYHVGDTVTVQGNTGSLVKTGYTFAGWNTQADGNGTTYTADETFTMGSSNVTLYAKWTANDYSVIYDGNGSTGGSVPSDASTYHIGDTVTVQGNTGGLVKTGYTFAGWNTQADGNGSTTYTADQTFTMGSSNVTLYAQWTINQYTVTFDANGGSGSMSPQSGDYNTTAALTSNSFTRTGYTFAGWNTQAAGGGIAYDDGADYTFTASITLYAQWTTISLAPSITLQPVNQTVVEGSIATFTADASGDPTPTVQWQESTNGGRKWRDIEGATSLTYTTPAATSNMDGFLYQAVFTNSAGIATTDAATLTVTPMSDINADVGITKSGSYDSGSNTITWTIVVTNNDLTNTAQEVEVKDSLANGTAVSDVNVPDGATYKVHGRNVIVDIPTLGPGDSATITIYALVTRATGTVDNTATVTTGTTDTNPDNNTSNTATVDLSQ